MQTGRVAETDRVRVGNAMSPRDPIVEQWIASALQSYPSASVPFLSAEDDPFRNPVGHTLRQSLTTLFDELRGNMETDRIAPALDALIRIRAVQDLTASQAVGFVFLLKPILRELAPIDASLNDRIDRLALMAFDKYMQCREELADIRVNEGQRRMHVRHSAG
ncbi:MAG: RsbRD N-terminal domain-containing protein [Acidobacteriia bacterium]|nr:RsbRD N-terminal domain-containing protein [Terriglobia bacterium]